MRRAERRSSWEQIVVTEATASIDGGDGKMPAASGGFFDGTGGVRRPVAGVLGAGGMRETAHAIQVAADEVNVTRGPLREADNRNWC